MYFKSLYFIYSTEKIIDKPVVNINWTNSTKGKKIINNGRPFKTNNAVIIKTAKEGRKLIKFAKTIDTGKK